MLLLIFDSTHDALRAEQVLMSKEYRLRIIPTPRAFSNSCGLSIRLEQGTWLEIRNLLFENGIKGCKYCECYAENGKISYGELKN